MWKRWKRHFCGKPLMSGMLLAKVLWWSKSFEPGRTLEAEGLMLPFLKPSEHHFWKSEQNCLSWQFESNFHEGQCGNPSTTAAKTFQLNFQLETCYLEILLTLLAVQIVCANWRQFLQDAYIWQLGVEYLHFGRWLSLLNVCFASTIDKAWEIAWLTANLVSSCMSRDMQTTKTLYRLVWHGLWVFCWVLLLSKESFTVEIPSASVFALIPRLKAWLVQRPTDLGRGLTGKTGFRLRDRINAHLGITQIRRLAVQKKGYYFQSRGRVAQFTQQIFHTYLPDLIYPSGTNAVRSAQ